MLATCILAGAYYHTEINNFFKVNENERKPTHRMEGILAR
jgi:hypothetical protein